jgi:hypothetical protein
LYVIIFQVSMFCFVWKTLKSSTLSLLLSFFFFPNTSTWESIKTAKRSISKPVKIFFVNPGIFKTNTNIYKNINNVCVFYNLFTQFTFKLLCIIYIKIQIFIKILIIFDFFGKVWMLVWQWFNIFSVSHFCLVNRVFILVLWEYFLNHYRP